MTAPLYQIVDWDVHFENAKSRTYDKCQYVVSPNKHGGSGFSNVMGEPDGGAIWGIWCLLKDLCSRQRRPREGWLTADGKKNGRRLTARELSNQFRRPISEIHRCLQVIQSPEVAFIRLVEGRPEHLQQAGDGYSADTEKLAAEPPGDRQAEDTAVSVEYPESVSARDTESKKVTKKILSQGEENGAEQPDTGRIADGQGPDTGGIADVVQHAEAKLILGGLAKEVFPDEAPGVIWDNKLEHDLDEVLPLNRSVLEKVEWCYRLAEGDRLFEDGPRGGGMMRVKSFAALIPNLKREASKITAARRKIGLNGLHEPKKVSAPAPARWIEAFVALWGERPDRPARFEELTSTQRAAVLEKCGELEGVAEELL